jgi:hypothetical protein
MRISLLRKGLSSMLLGKSLAKVAPEILASLAALRAEQDEL